MSYQKDQNANTSRGADSDASSISSSDTRRQVGASNLGRQYSPAEGSLRYRSVDTMGQDLLKRYSSVGGQSTSLWQMGAPNSIDNFVNSLQRAAAFHEISSSTRRDRILVETSEPMDNAHSSQYDSRQQRSLLSEQIQEASRPSPTENIAQSPGTGRLNLPAYETTSLLSVPHRSSSFSYRRRSEVEQHLGTSYGSMSSKLSQTTRRRVMVLAQQQIQENQMLADMSDEEDIIVPRNFETHVRSDGEVVEQIVGESTVPMTIFNSMNVMIGVGILTLPLAINYTGWAIGIPMLVAVALITEYTAKLLARCLETNSASMTYGDIAFLSFGRWGRMVVEFIFVLELTVSNVALIILFGDSVHSLTSNISVDTAKAAFAMALIPLNFTPLKYLSLTSVLGICCMMSIILLILVDGVIKPSAPGSLRQPAIPQALPDDLRTIPVGFGLFMAPLGGHPVFPAIYRDMRHPRKYPKAVRTTYSFIFGFDLTILVLGYLMFGKAVRDEITANILSSTAYPKALSVVMIIVVGIIPVTKIPLNNRPLIDMITYKFLSRPGHTEDESAVVVIGESRRQPLRRRMARFVAPVSLNLVQLGIAIGFPDFDSVMGFMGSILCVSTCIVLPVSFYLKVFWKSEEVSPVKQAFCFALIAVSIAFGISGTVFSSILDK